MHRTGLSLRDDTLACPHGCQYPIIDGVPVLLLAGKPPTMELAHTSSIPTPERDSDGGLYVESLGLIDEEKRGILRLAEDKSSKIDPVVSFLIGATNGIAYKSLIGKLAEYPVPEIRLPLGDGKVFLDLGCSWGRWCIAAARKGYRAVGIDPSLGAVMAAKRVAKQLGVEATYVVGDARFLPFRQSAIDCVFSYSVLQHFSREDAATARRVGTSVTAPGSKSGIGRFRRCTDFSCQKLGSPISRWTASSALGCNTPTAICSRLWPG